MTGTAVGVGVVLVMVAASAGARAEILGRIEALGRNLLVIAAADAPSPGTRPGTASKVTTLTVADAEALLERAPALRLAAPAADRGVVVRFGRRSATATLRATTPEWREIRDFRLARGRFFTHGDDAALARVGVLGALLAETLFGDDEAVGQVVYVGLVPIEVVGVLEPKGLSVDGSAAEDDQLVVPLRTGLRRLLNVDEVRMIYAQVAAPELMEDATDEIGAVLRERHRLAELERPDDFVVQNQAVLLEAELETLDTFRAVTGALAGVALLVGGVGILAVMQLAVRERTSEIGLRVAVGARRRDIRAQFLGEALMLGAGGGAVGVALGWAAALLVGRTTQWSTAVTPAVVAWAAGSALAIGVVFGLTPAMRAARLDPIEALRAE
jgi:putative ABC transport system permease protein